MGGIGLGTKLVLHRLPGTSTHCDNIADVFVSTFERFHNLVDAVDHHLSTSRLNEDISDDAFQTLEPGCLGHARLIVVVFWRGSEESVAPSCANLCRHIVGILLFQGKRVIDREVEPWADKHGTKQRFVQSDLAGDLWMRVQNVRKQRHCQVATRRISSDDDLQLSINDGGLAA